MLVATAGDVMEWQCRDKHTHTHTSTHARTHARTPQMERYIEKDKLSTYFTSQTMLLFTLVGLSVRKYKRVIQHLSYCLLIKTITSCFRSWVRRIAHQSWLSGQLPFISTANRESALRIGSLLVCVDPERGNTSQGTVFGPLSFVVYLTDFFTLRRRVTSTSMSCRSLLPLPTRPRPQCNGMPTKRLRGMIAVIWN